MLNVLYISYDGMTDPLGQSQVIPYILKLTEAGYKITLLSCEKPARYTHGKSTIEAILKNTSITWVPILYTKKPPVLSTVYDFFKLRRKARLLHLKTNFQLVHARSYIPAMIGLWLKKKYKTKFIFDMRGFWADERVDGGLWNLKNPLYKMIYRFFKDQERRLLEGADYIVVLTEKAKDEMFTWKHVSINHDRVQVIPCCADLGLFDPDNVSQERVMQIKRELGLSSHSFIISYLGSIGTWYLLSEMLSFFKALKQKVPAAQFLFITMDEHAYIRKTAQELGIAQEDILIRPAERKLVPTVLSLSKWSLFFIKPSYSKMSSSPTKQGEIMAMGIPLICNNGIGDTDRIVNDFRSGVVVNNFNFQEALLKMEQYQQDPIAIRTGASTYFSLDNGTKQYRQIYRILIPN